MYVEAIRMINRYRLHMSGVTYAQQGLALDSAGTLPARVVDEHRLVHDCMSEAQNELERQKAKEMRDYYKKLAGRR